MTDTVKQPTSQIVTCPTCGRANRVPFAAPGKPTCAVCHSPLPWLVPAGDEDIDRIAVEADLPVLLDLWAPWCGPCHAVAPHIERASRTFAGRLKVVKVNVDEAPRTAERFGVRGVPTLIVLDHGQPLARQVGALPASQLERWIEEALAKTSAGRA